MLLQRLATGVKKNEIKARAYEALYAHAQYNTQPVGANPRRACARVTACVCPSACVCVCVCLFPL